MEKETINPEEYNVIQCKRCQKTMKRFYVGRYNNLKDKRYVNEEGREFSGHVCPDCHAYRCAQRSRLKRESKQGV